MNAPHTSWAYRLRARYTVGLVAFVAAGLLLLWLCRQPALLVLLGVAIGVALYHASRWLAERTGAPRGLMLALVVLLGLAGIVAFGYLVGPRFVQEGRRFVESAPALLDQARQMLGMDPISTEGGASNLSGLFGRALGVFSTALGAFAALLVVVLVAIYSAINPSLYVDGFVRLFRPDHRPVIRDVLAEMDRTLLSWVQGVLIAVAVLTLMGTVGLSLVGVPMAVALGMFAGLWTVIPNFGPFIGWAPAVLVGFASGTTTGFWALGLALTAQQLEGSVITPKVQQRMVHVGPALIITGQIVLGTLVGLLGVLMAVPVLALGSIAVRRLYIEPRAESGDRPDPDPAVPPDPDAPA